MVTQPVSFVTLARIQTSYFIKCLEEELRTIGKKHLCLYGKFCPTISDINFDEVKVSGLDLSNTNISLNPQTVYNKDMSNGIYDGVKFINNNFTGVNTDNSSFKDCDVPFTEFEIAEILD